MAYCEVRLRLKDNTSREQDVGQERGTRFFIHNDLSSDDEVNPVKDHRLGLGVFDMKQKIAEEIQKLAVAGVENDLNAK
ncbi:uncharacterized protein RCO7_15111 [Rhynchosporium graminicola]|uniref:Uncharacterized protein n=1 Tax=Rhynchosporium graminicola TaxID=2792576 RepID=A0A1E1LMN7_9HELO|nr:uncharacterized protein RCO7_15111 [Rhynchosporium commune]